MLAFAQISSGGDYTQDFTYTELKEEEYKFLDSSGNPCPIFNVQEATENEIIFTTASDSFMVYDRTKKDIIKKIYNPSTIQNNPTVNYNVLEKICNFSLQNPYLVYKDSRSIGVINVHSNLAFKLKDCPYKICGNIFSMVHSLVYCPDPSKPQEVTNLSDLT